MDKKHEVLKSLKQLTQEHAFEKQEKQRFTLESSSVQSQDHCHTGGGWAGGLSRTETRVMVLIGVSLEAVLGRGHTKARKEMRTRHKSKNHWIVEVPKGGERNENHGMTGAG